jgi:hypothetical protein
VRALALGSVVPRSEKQPHLRMRGQGGAGGAREPVPAAAAASLRREQQLRHRRLVGGALLRGEARKR